MTAFRRLVRFVIHNWPLKVAAILVAVLLYAGLVLSENAQVWRGRVAITPLHQPTTAVLLGSLPDVTSIRYFAPTDVASRLSTSSFSAVVDLSSAAPTAEDPFVTARVEVMAADSRVQVLDYEPQVVRIQLDPLVSKTVPVTVDHGVVPAGLNLGDPVLSSGTVTVSGGESVVRLVATAVARVIIQPSGIDVDQQVDLVALDASGNVRTPVDIEPATVRVQIRVGSQLRSKSLPVNPVVTGTPADGWEVASVDVTPAVATVEGDANALAALQRLDTVPLSISGASTDVSKSVAIALPDGTTALGSATVKVTAHLRQLTGTRTFQVGVAPTGARSDLTYQLAAPSVSVTLGGPIAALDAVDPTALVARVDVSSLDAGTRTLPVIFSLPTGTSLVAMAPGSVDVTAAASATPSPPPTGAP